MTSQFYENDHVAMK